MLQTKNNFRWQTVAQCITVCCLCFALDAYPQKGTITGNGTVTYNADGSVSVSGTKIFTSYISSSEGKEDMVRMDVIGLYRYNADLSGGIKAQVNSNGKVRLSVYSLGPAGLSAVPLYSVDLNVTSSDYSGIPWEVSMGTGKLYTDQVRALTQLADLKLASQCSNTYSLFDGTLAYLKGQVPVNIATPLYACLKGNNYLLTQPVIVVVEVTDATVQGVKFPGMTEEFDLANYFDLARALSVEVIVNAVPRATYTAGNDNPSPLNLVMGDLISYKVSYGGNRAPVIEGMPAVWIAQFAGDLMYYCSPSVTPGEFNPWLGYDSRVHTLQLRKYPGDFTVKVLPWNTDQPHTWTWSWTAQRRMNANSTRYTPVYTWQKWKTLPKSTAIQRNNQREGLNVQFLQYWQNGLESNFKQYAGKAKYMMGFDDDELMYLNGQDHDATRNKPLVGIVKLDSIPSRGMPEGKDQIYDATTGYPAQGFPLNISISAYRKNRESILNSNNNYFRKYDGYEIQDLGTDDKNPDGTGTGNNMAPGLITVRAGNQVVKIKLNVKAPLKEDKGHYGALEGERWPAYNQKDVPYTLNGLTGLSEDELNKFSMEYEGTNSLGTQSRQTKYLRDLPLDKKLEVATFGKWTSYFTIDPPIYPSVTAYYQRTPTSEKIIVAGKELKTIFLMFMGEKSLEGKGLGGKIWLNDYRTGQYGDYQVPRRFGKLTRYMTKYIRSYTFQAGTTTTFSAWDGDPHMFYEDPEWFLSSRTLAKRIPDSYLDGTATPASTPYLEFYVDGILQNSGRSGKDFTYTWNSPGEHELKVVYKVNNDGSLTTYYHKINVTKYGNAVSPVGNPLGEIKGAIIIRDLTPFEQNTLQLPDGYKMAEVTNVLSPWMYKAGPRATNGNAAFQMNRWADFNDFDSRYIWRFYQPCQFNGNDCINDFSQPAEVQSFINEYSNTDWFWRDWALHYSSNWRDNMKINGKQGLPPYVPNSQVTRVITTELDKFATYIQKLFKPLAPANWQFTVPLVSYAEHQGNRMRTNPSCLYDINAVWSNTSGAFSGNPNLPDDENAIGAPDITDGQKDLQELYYDLKSGKKMVMRTPQYRVGWRSMITVSHVSDRIDPELFIASWKINRGAASSARANRETASDELTGSEETTVHPNPNSGKFQVSFEKPVTGKVRILMTDIVGRVLFNETQDLGQMERYTVDVNTQGLRKGTYVLNVTSGQGQYTQRIMIE